MAHRNRFHAFCHKLQRGIAPGGGFATLTRMTSWLLFSLLTVVSWGVYGIFLHTGQMAMADPVNGRYKAFLFVGIAYFLTAVLAPLAVLMAKGASWNYPARGMT